jgi:hypothetical protein
MTLIGYDQNIPNPPNNPSNDVGIMQTNALALFNILKVDHFGFNVNNSGWHQQATFPLRTGTPTTTAGQLALFSTNFVLNQPAQLCYVRDNTGTLFALTGSIDPFLTIGGANGQQTYGLTALPGPIVAGGAGSAGMFMQFGYVNASPDGSFHTLNFSTNNFNFPNNCFAVFTQPYGTGTPPLSQATVQIRQSTINKTSFQWTFFTSSSQYTGFYWMAIGN